MYIKCRNYKFSISIYSDMNVNREKLCRDAHLLTVAFSRAHNGLKYYIITAHEIVIDRIS